MLKLYYVPDVCSQSPHIALREAGLPFELDRLDLKNNKRTESGENYWEVNPKGYVPALRLPDGNVLTEGVAIVQYIADLKPEARLAPKVGSFERVRLQEWLNFIATELHKGMSPLYSPVAAEDYKKTVRERFALRLGALDKAVQGNAFLMGERFTIADGYAFYVLRAWQKRWGGPVPAATAAYFDRLSQRPAIQAALAAEGLA